MKTFPLTVRRLLAAAPFALAGCTIAAGGAGARVGAVEILKQMPAKGVLRQGEVVYVDDGECPPGEIKKVIGGGQKSGVARQVECVKRPANADHQ